MAQVEGEMSGLLNRGIEKGAAKDENLWIRDVVPKCT